MRPRITGFLFTLLFLGSLASYSQNEALFNSGKEAYKSASYQAAIQQWKKIIDNGEHSAAVYFNLGNAYYKLNDIGPSIYYYEKALQLAPNDSDIKNNLAFAENARIDVIEPLPKTVFALWYQRFTSALSFNGWAISAVCFSSLFVGLFLMYYYATSETRKRIFFVTALMSVFMMLLTLAVSFMTASDAAKDRPAIIFSESVDVRDAPSVSGEVSFVLHEGTKVQVLDEDAEWVRIKLADGKDGWILVSALKEL
jgi:hypothetical protein